MNEKINEVLIGLYLAAKKEGPLAVARVVECAVRRGYSVSDLERAIERRAST